jgi:hypothetical protein
MQLTPHASLELVCLLIALGPALPLLVLAWPRRPRTTPQSRAVHNPEWRVLCRLNRIVR